MSKVLSVELEKCTGCRVCELVCSMKHSGEYNPIKSRIHVSIFPREVYAIPLVCFQCEDAWCEKICPTNAIGAIMDNEAGVKIVEVFEDRCVGCKICLLACPFGNMGLNDKGYAVKCDLCDGDPECVKFCARGALKFEEAEISMISKRKTISEMILVSYQR